MATSERIAAVAGKLSRLKSRHNDLAEEISELEDELRALRREGKRGAAKTQPAAKTRRASGHADEDLDDDDDADNDDAGDEDDDTDDDTDDAGDDEDEKPRTRRPRR